MKVVDSSIFSLLVVGVTYLVDLLQANLVLMFVLVFVPTQVVLQSMM